MPYAPRSITSLKPRRQPEHRPHSAARGYDERWKRFRLAWLAELFAAGNVYCSWCGKLLDGDSRSIHVDHKRPHNGDETLMYDPNNLAAMHAACHSRKTIAQDGGFGRGKVRMGGGHQSIGRFGHDHVTPVRDTEP